ncbi:MAG TPA: hypothetical protein VG204_01055 [Terriglobia bacterium]|nr:hypothetical protein [Terriglobia bacterium]
MKKTLLSVLVLALFAFLGVLSLAAQEAEKPAPEAAPKAAASGKKAMAGWSKPETMSGTILLVKSEDKLVVVNSSAGTPYDFKVSGGTKIKVGDKAGKLDDLAGATGKQATVNYVPTRTGNAAKSIDVGQ